MSVVGSTRSSFSGRNASLYPIISHEDSGLEIPSGFKRALPVTVGRRHRGFRRDEVKKFEDKFPSDVAKSDKLKTLSEIDEMRSKLDVDSPTKAAHSKTSSLDIILDEPVEHQETTDRKKSCWQRGLKAEKTLFTWENSGFNEEKVGSQYGPISLNSLPKRRPRKSSAKVNSKVVQSKEMNLPPLPSIPKHSQESQIPSYKSFPPSHLTKLASIIHQPGNKETANNTRTSGSETESSFVHGKIRDKSKLGSSKMATVHVSPEAALPPHLRPKPSALENRTTQLKAETPKPLQSQQATDILEASPKSLANVSPMVLPHRLTEAGFKSALTTAEEEKATKHPSQQQRRTSLSIKSQSSSLVMAEEEHKVTIRKDLREDSVSGSKPNFENTPPQNHAHETESVTSHQPSGQNHETSASAKTLKAAEARPKDEPSLFTWISGQEHTGLQGWDNKMMPAPIGEEWTMRDPHDSNGAKHKAVVEMWANDQLEDQTGKAVEIDVNSPEFLTGQGIIDEGVGIQQGIQASLHDAIPDVTTLHEPKRQLNTEDIIKERIARHGLISSEEIPSKHEKRDPISGETKAERRERLEFARTVDRNLNLEPNEHTPVANIYMRPAESKDISMITDLHNKFIANHSVATSFVKASEESMWRRTLEDCFADCSPFFVAIISQSQARAMQVKDVRRGKFESVVGFAYGIDYGAADNAYRITLEIEIWVDPRHQHQGIGKTLLDRMLACLDPMYAWKDPVPFLDMGHKMKWMGGGHRNVKTLIVGLLYSDDEKEEVGWKKAWLMKSDFQVGGVIPHMARKNRKQVNLCQMYYTTGHDVSHIFQ